MSKPKKSFFERLTGTIRLDEDTAEEVEIAVENQTGNWLEEEEKDILELGWDEARRDGVCLVEWPSRLGSLLPKDRLEISIAFVKDSENSREIALRPFGSWVKRLP